MTHTVILNWARIKSEDEFYEWLLPQLNAPGWHRKDLVDLFDSLAIGRINGVEAPFTIVNLNKEEVVPSMFEFQKRFYSILEYASRKQNIRLLDQ